MTMNDIARRLLQDSLQEEAQPAAVIHIPWYAREAVSDMPHLSASDGWYRWLSHPAPPATYAGWPEVYSPGAIAAIPGSHASVHGVPVPAPVLGEPYRLDTEMRNTTLNAVVAHPDDAGWVKDVIEGAGKDHNDRRDMAVADIVRAAPAHYRKHGPFTADELAHAVLDDGATVDYTRPVTDALEAAGWRGKPIRGVIVWYRR